MESESGAQQVAHARGAGSQLAWTLVLAYLLVVAYASLQPFSDWRFPPSEIRHFLTAPWPPYITLVDILVNIGAYLPLGFLLAIALIRRLGPRTAVLLAVVGAGLLSIAMEAAQTLMPTRVASNVDVLANTLGGLIGALAAPLFAPPHGLGLRLAHLRRDWFVQGRTADLGLMLVSLWLVTQLHPTGQLFGTGHLRDTFELPVWFVHTPQALLTAEAAVAGFNFLGIGLVVVALAQDTVPRGLVIAAVLGTAVAIKAFAGLALAKLAGSLAWLTPGVALGVVLAAIVLYGLSHVPRRVQWTAAAVSLAVAIAAINVAPDNPYQTLPPQLLPQGPTHFLSFSEIVRALSELWPFVAILYAAVAAATPRNAISPFPASR